MNLPAKLFSALMLATALGTVPANVDAQQSVQPGFFSHEPTNVDIRISNARSGELCDDVAGAVKVCTTVSKIVVTGRETCNGGDGKQYPCTRYGYAFDYSGAEPGETIECSARRRDAFNTQSMNYALDLDGDAGSVFYPTWIAYGPVQQRVIVTEVHECAYRGAMLSTIEFLLYYEPGTSSAAPAPGITEPLFSEIPNACSYLTVPLAQNLLRVPQVDASVSNEHIPNFWSQCTYSAVGATGRSVGFVFKFMLYDLYDIATLDDLQLNFNATFTGGGDAPVDTLEDLGKIAFVFDKRDRTTLMVVTGIQGPPDGANRPTEFVANYYLEDPDTPHAARLSKLRALAEAHLAEWHAR